VGKTISLLRIRSRNTPTYVGETLLHFLPAIIQQKHPHVCGENNMPALVEAVETTPLTGEKFNIYISQGNISYNKEKF